MYGVWLGWMGLEKNQKCAQGGLCEMRELEKELNIIKEKLGIKAFDAVLDWVVKKEMRIDDLVKSRDNWKKKYYELKHA